MIFGHRPADIWPKNLNSLSRAHNMSQGYFDLPEHIGNHLGAHRALLSIFGQFEKKVLKFHIFIIFWVQNENLKFLKKLFAVDFWWYLLMFWTIANIFWQQKGNFSCIGRARKLARAQCIPRARLKLNPQMKKLNIYENSALSGQKWQERGLMCFSYRFWLFVFRWGYVI